MLLLSQGMWLPFEMSLNTTARTNMFVAAAHIAKHHQEVPTASPIRVPSNLHVCIFGT